MIEKVIVGMISVAMCAVIIPAFIICVVGKFIYELMKD